MLVDQDCGEVNLLVGLFYKTAAVMTAKGMPVASWVCQGDGGLPKLHGLVSVLQDGWSPNGLHTCGVGIACLQSRCSESGLLG